ncbi:MAG TPA: hypothetical protein VLV17_03325 [Anaeromyxobacteraceae bacterium]|nr:hypothetical protein [Anaeromyxobacteraceae bacterium]
MDCEEVKLLLLDTRRKGLEPPLGESVSAHLAACPSCQRAEAVERTLDDLLQATLLREAAPSSLRQELERSLAAEGEAEAVPSRPLRTLRRWASSRSGLAATGLAACLAVSLFVLFERGGPGGVTLATLTGEAVNDHLRVLVSEHPLEIESGINHQVKPWFEGRLDFAPVVPVPEVPDLHLSGGAIGYFLDRKAAVVEYHLGRHAVTLLAFRGDGLPDLPENEPALSSARGFAVARWRAGGVGYALVSDIASQDLRKLADLFAAESAH